MRPKWIWVVALVGVMAALVTVVLTVVNRGAASHEALTADPTKHASTADTSPIVSPSELDARTTRTTSTPAEEPVPNSSVGVGGRAVAVRSSTGLRVNQVEVLDATAAWIRVDCNDGALLLERDDRIVHIRAAGHREMALTPSATELVLEPDALLAIEGRALRAEMHDIDLAIDPSEQYQPGRRDFGDVVMSGFVSDERWLVAISASTLEEADVKRRLEDSFTKHPYRRSFFRVEGNLEALFIAFGLTDGRGVRIAYMARPGARDSWRAETISVDSLPLVVQVSGDSSAAPHELITELFDSRDDLPTTAVEYAWGVATVLPAANEEQARTWEPGISTFDFGSRPLHRRYGVIVRASDSSVYGRRFFDHDGSVQRIVLQEGLTLQGTLRGDDGSSGPDAASFQWARRFQNDAQSPLRSGTTSIGVGADGAFVVRGPTELSRKESDPDTLPPIVDLAITATDFQPFHGVFDAGSERHFDAGTIEMSTGVHDFFIPLQPTVGGFALNGSGAFHILTQGDVSWITRVVASRWDARRNGTVITLARDETGAITTETDSKDVSHLATPAWSDTRVTSIAQRSESGGFFVYERLQDETFERVATVDHTLHVDFTAAESDDLLLRVEYDWRGLKSSGSHRRVTLEPLRFDVNAPASDAALWRWELYSEPPREGFAPFLLDGYRPKPEGKLLASGSVPMTSREMTIRIP